MDNTLKTLVISLITLGVSGVTTLAFVEPPIYAVAFYVLVALIILANIVAYVRSAAIMDAQIAINRARLAGIEGGKLDSSPEASVARDAAYHVAHDAVSKLEVHFWRVMTISFVCFLYLVCLKAVPELRQQLEAPSATSQQQSHPKL